MTVAEVLTALEMALREGRVQATSQVKVRHMADLSPNHWTTGHQINGDGDFVLWATWRTDDPERDGAEYRPS